MTKCDQCRAAYAERNPPQDPPCDTCRIDLMPQNAEAAEIYMIVRNQVITVGMGGQIIDISIPAICNVMDRYPRGIKDQWKCLHKIFSVFHHFNKEKS